MYLASSDRLDTNSIFKKAGILEVSDAQAFNAWQGYGLEMPLFAKSVTGDALSTYSQGSFTSNPSPALREGIVQAGGKSVGYLQLLTFNNPQIYGGSQHDQQADWLDVIRTFVRSLKSSSLDLVLDLRENPGGDPTLADQLMAILAEAGKTYGGGAMAFRTSDSEGGILWGDGSGALPASMPSLFTVDEVSKIFSVAYQAAQPQTPIFVEGDISADESVGGYSGKIVTLLGDQCISACDRMAAHLGRSGRALLVGQPSNGTGLGYADNSLFYQWSDWHSLVQSQIPAHLFGVAPTPLGTNPKDHILPFEANADSYLTENRPTIPSISFNPSLDDVLFQNGKSAGWESAIAQALGSI